MTARMNNFDARKLSPQQQKILRIKAVDIVFKHGFTKRATAGPWR